MKPGPIGRVIDDNASVGSEFGDDGKLMAHSTDAHSDARRDADPDLERLNELWPMLVADDRAALLAHAEHLAALRGGATLERVRR